ncbi:MAG: DUF1569 domain-containing protein [Chitinophagaceae bacterium]|jgi:hypothetical protein|nr:DUF1569 domain-containing protein [Chitinophagaceae bacterium]
MASNIFNTNDYNAICQRLSKVQAQSLRQWGTMTPAQMLRHCRAQIDFILAPAANVKVYPTPFRFGPIKWLALYGMAWPKNSKTAPELDVNKKLNDTGEFQQEYALLTEALQKLVQRNAANAIHPLFGRLGRKDWGRVVWKHLDHHLRQFSA